MSLPNNQIERNKAIFNLADEYLLDLVKTHVLKSNSASNAQARQVLEKYLTPEERPQSMTGKEGVFHRLAYTAQDWGMATTVIGKAIGGVEKLEEVLFSFNPQEVAERYSNPENREALLDTIVTELKPTGKINRGKQALWPRYCRTIITGAVFLSQFKNAEDFYSWIEPLERDAARRIELPLRLQREIRGYGFALSCIFFMDIGYASFLKPDIWVIRFCNQLGIVSSEKPHAVFDAAVQFAEQVGVTPFALDRMIWLIGTGDFWLDKVDARSQLEKFVTKAHTELKSSAEEPTQRERDRMERFIWREGDIEIIKPQD
jgi:hypothetical protein